MGFHLSQIREVEDLGHLSHLRVLNLAGNEITCASSLTGLTALAELNFRRNRITHVVSYMPSYTQCHGKSLTRVPELCT